MTRLPSVALAVVLAVAGCNKGYVDTGPPDLSPAAKAKWKEYCDFRTACGITTACPSTMCMASVAEEGPLAEFVDCQVAKACGANDDACVAGAGTTDAEREAFVPRCEAAIRAYQSMDQSTPPVCYVETTLCTVVAYPLIQKQYMHGVDGCLTVPCDELMACLDVVLHPLDCF